MLSSKTVWGGLLWAAAIFLKGVGVEYPVLLPLLGSVGTFLAVWGARDALD